MTALGPASPRRPGAAALGLELRRALAARGVTQRAAAAAVGASRGAVANWASGDALPPPGRADRLAELLAWPRLAEIARAARRRECDACGREFQPGGSGPARYCSVGCRRWQAGKRVPGRRDLTRSVLERRSARLSAAVAAMCAWCEPGGLCRTPSCPLQGAGASPLRVDPGALR